MRPQFRILLLTLTVLVSGSSTVVGIQAPARAATSTLTVQVDKSAAATNPVQWGHILEDINYSVEGGLNANLIRNGTMSEGGKNPPTSWSLLTTGGGAGVISTHSTTPLNAVNDKALKLSVTTNGGDRSVGVANSGFWGVGLSPSTSYTATFFARTSGGFTGRLKVSLESTDGRRYAVRQTSPLTSAWKKYTVKLVTSPTTPRGKANRVAFYPDGKGTGDVFLNVVRVLPPTYERTGLLRKDLMERMGGTRPSFWRVPGGNYLEGNTLATRFDWKATIGSVESRPGHQNDAWGYWSTDQVGLKAYLDMAESTGAEPLLGLFAGYTLNGFHVAKEDLGPYVQDALDEIEYVIGSTKTTWGARRAADGHPAPYRLTYVEVGNEDFFDYSGSYDGYRFAMFYDAIRATYPHLKIVASAPVTSRTPDVVDDHYYNNDPAAFTAMADLYDDADRNGPQHLIGEYAVTNGTTGNPTGTLGGAIGEAGFMTGLLRNADVVVGAAYAPALANVNAFQWPTNLIGFDALDSYVAPSYYVQQLFGRNLGDFVTPTTFSGVDSKVTHVATRAKDGSVYVHVVNPTPSAVTSTVHVAGARTVASKGTVTVLTGDPNARNTITAPTTIAPVTSTFTASSSFGHTFPANSVTMLKVKVTGSVTPYLAIDRGITLRPTSAGSTDRSVSATTGTGVTAVVNASSTAEAKKQATFFVRSGLADAGCYSLESRAHAGQYLRRQNNTVVLTAPDGTSSFAGDATFCAAKGNSGSGVSFTSKTSPTRYLRHHNGRLYLATKSGSNPYNSNPYNSNPYNSNPFNRNPYSSNPYNSNPHSSNPYSSKTGWAAETTFRVSSGWWRSNADVPSGRVSFQVTTAGLTNHSMRHFDFVARIDPITASDDLTAREDATFTVVPGLADSSCYSFTSANFPGRYLRHYDYRLRLDPKDSSTYFPQDATFCAQPGNNGTGISWQSYNYPNRYLRHFAYTVFISGNAGPMWFDAAGTGGWANDSSWNMISAWAP
jgi:hypothetical protein